MRLGCFIISPTWWRISCLSLSERDCEPHVELSMLDNALYMYFCVHC